MSSRHQAIDLVAGKHRFRVWEITPWALAGAAWLLTPEYLPLGAQIIIMILFALSYDIVVGYAGIVILGHTAFFGVGAYTAGLLAVAGWDEPLSGLVAGALAAAIVGAIAGAIILRTSGLTLLMLGMALTLLLAELANRFSGITGGHDGLQGITIAPLLGIFEFDIFGRVAFIYCLAVLFVSWLVIRALVYAPFGRSLVGIRLNPTRMQAIGVPVRQRKLIAFTISAAFAGIAGALSAQVNQFVSLSAFGLQAAGAVLIVLVLGGRGQLYGAFLGACTYMIVQDFLAKGDPVFWLFWIGLMLIIIVLVAPRGLAGVVGMIHEALGKRLRSMLRRTVASKCETAP